ncbi:pentapeptide repeat-containing protein [Dactylosporangium sp. NPDC000244]|uniref:pentapeptide repeat-containing protein n=1 Tax=Dactylosporangium sp. NPDC000244 TaxID=3154365 RepID=UPI00331BAA9A
MTAFAGIVSLLLVAAGLFYTNDANRRQQQANRDQLKVAEQGQFTDRFGKAVEQLGQEGDDKLGVRLGGIYALERLMNDSPRDEPAIIEVLCAFVRIHAPRLVEVPPPARPPSSPDVQAAVTVLGRRPSPLAKGNSRLDFNSALLSMPAAELLGSNLAGANLEYANLLAGGLNNADLHGAYLRNANLQGAVLRAANLDSADLNGADLRSADLRNADLRGADLSGADMDGSPEQLFCSWVDDATKLPPYVTRPIENAPERNPACK